MGGFYRCLGKTSANDLLICRRPFHLMPNYSIQINGRLTQVSADPDTPLLWVLRDSLNLLGTEFGWDGR